MSMNMYAVILAGGKGERFWPMSTSERPKQMLALTGNRPLVASAVERLEGLIPQERIFIITSDNLVEPTKNVLPSFPEKNIIGEPIGRDTAAAVTLGAALVQAQDRNAGFCVLTADHVISDPEVFIRTLKDAFDMASEDVLITIGMKPSFASTAFGYIETQEPLPYSGTTKFFKVKRFVEKPDSETALQYLNAGSFYWNSGMFIWSAAAYERALEKHHPVLKNMLIQIKPTVGGNLFSETLASVYAKLDKISVDYALMEKADNIIMAKGEFTWDDVGSWTALTNHIEKDGHDNARMGAVENLDSSGNIVVAEQGMIALCGVKDMVVVRTADVTLVCSKERAQDVKKIVALLKEKGRYDNIL